MKLFVKSLKGIHFQIEVNPHDTVRDVKKNIESVQGTNVYPATQQMLIYQGRALADGTTLEENKVSENSFIVVMLCKSKIFTEESSVAASAMPTSKSKSSYVGTSVAATTATPTSKCNSSSGDSSVPAAIMRLMPTFKIKKSPGESSVAPATLPKSKSKSSSEDGSGAAAAMPVSKNKFSSEKVSVAADPMPASNSKSSSGDGSGAAAAMPVSKSKISSEKSSVAADPMPASNSKSSSGKSSVAAADMPISKSNSSSGDSSVAAAAMPISKTKRSSKKSSVSAAPMPTSNSESSPCDNSVAAAAIPTSKAPATPEPPFVEAPTTRPISVTTESVPASVSTSAPSPIIASSASESAVGGQAASDLAAGNGLENTIQTILNIGGGIWDRDTVVRALDVAYNNPERAVEYLCSGVPEQAEAGKAANASTVSQQPTQPATVPSSRSNAGPLNIFPQGLHTQGSNAPLSGPLDFLRNSEQFQALRAMVQANPETLQPLLQEFGRKNPNLLRLIQEHQADFQRLLNEPVAGKHGNILEQFAAAMPQSIQVTPAEHKAIERLEAMGFDRSTVLEAYFACNKNEELTANYLLDHMHEFED